MTRPKLTVVIGANGAGKTTWAREHRDTLPRPFYNADSIAEGLGDANDPGLQRTARELVDQQIERDLADQRSFGFESTYSGRSRPDIVKRAKALGYATGAVFIGTRHHAINIKRVQRRVREGGHPHRGLGSETALEGRVGKPARDVGCLRHDQRPRQLEHPPNRDRSQDRHAPDGQDGPPTVGARHADADTTKRSRADTWMLKRAPARLRAPGDAGSVPNATPAP